MREFRDFGNSGNSGGKYTDCKYPVPGWLPLPMVRSMVWGVVPVPAWPFPSRMEVESSRFSRSAWTMKWSTWRDWGGGGGEVGGDWGGGLMGGRCERKSGEEEEGIAVCRSVGVCERAGDVGGGIEGWSEVEDVEGLGRRGGVRQGL